MNRSAHLDAAADRQRHDAKDGVDEDQSLLEVSVHCPRMQRAERLQRHGQPERGRRRERELRKRERWDADRWRHILRRCRKIRGREFWWNDRRHSEWLGRRSGDSAAHNGRSQRARRHDARRYGRNWRERWGRAIGRRFRRRERRRSGWLSRKRPNGDGRIRRPGRRAGNGWLGGCPRFRRKGRQWGRRRVVRKCRASRCNVFGRAFDLVWHAARRGEREERRARTRQVRGEHELSAVASERRPTSNLPLHGGGQRRTLSPLRSKQMGRASDAAARDVLAWLGQQRKHLRRPEQ